MKNVLVFIIAILVFFALGFWAGKGMDKKSDAANYHIGYTAGYQAGLAHIKSISELQEQVGAEPDGIWGRETDRLYDKAYCNQENVKMFKRMSTKE